MVERRSCLEYLRRKYVHTPQTPPFLFFVPALLIAGNRQVRSTLHTLVSEEANSRRRCPDRLRRGTGRIVNSICQS